MSLTKKLYYLALIGSLTSCGPIKLKSNGEYVHSYKNVHSQNVIIKNGSELRIVNNISMMYFDSTHCYNRSATHLIILEDQNHLNSQTHGNKRTIFVKNSKTLIVNGEKFKFQRFKPNCPPN